MKFARVVFLVAGTWGVCVLTPLYFLRSFIGRQVPPPINHPGYYYGFIGAGLAWQLAFFFIAMDPARYRPLMIPAMLEKFSYAIALVVLFLRHEITANEMAGMTDLFLGILFLIAYRVTKPTGCTLASKEPSELP
jgi:drug/metabolite transporter (DMT)-like permease